MCTKYNINKILLSVCDLCICMRKMLHVSKHDNGIPQNVFYMYVHVLVCFITRGSPQDLYP